MMHWYALHVKPHKERSVHQLLLAREIDVFFPTIRVKPKNPRAAKIRPYFPGYMFVRADLETRGQTAFSWLPGSHKLVSFGGEPSIVPDNLIHDLHKHMAQIASEEISMLNSLKPGDRVRITEGPLAGYDAIFDRHLPGNERVQVLLAFLSQHPQPTQLNADMIIKVK